MPMVESFLLYFSGGYKKLSSYHRRCNIEADIKKEKCKFIAFSFGVF